VALGFLDQIFGPGRLTPTREHLDHRLSQPNKGANRFRPAGSALEANRVAIKARVIKPPILHQCERVQPESGYGVVDDAIPGKKPPLPAASANKSS
jgi:hypothetical protein